MTHLPTPARGLGIAETLPAGPVPVAPAPVLPTRIGRFSILERLGTGAMGVVFSAYDETLDRKVAVKVLHDDDVGAQSRLVREAQAMARVSHPNVVSVLEAGMANGRVYVAMEFVRGVTLGAWLDAAPREWAAIVEVFVQAGRGLAAAHVAGLVHRDFKPSNVMIDDTGRVRVLDFGLVRAAPGRPLAELVATGTHSHVDLQLTHDDELVGTPAYMAPEQWRGAATEPATDQFSFCVALYEALYGQPPFPRDDVPGLVRAVLRDPPRAPPRRLGTPTWLAGVVLRGMRQDPKDRYPSMSALLAELERRRPRGWRRAAAAGALAAVAAVAGFAVAQREPPACTGAADEVARVWGAAQRDAVSAALYAAVPKYADTLWPRVVEGFDRYSGAWAELHHNACLAHVHGERSDMLLDRQMRCLERRLGALDEAVRTLAGADVDIASRALEVAGDLPSLAPCRDLEALTSERPPPEDPEVARRVAELRARMTHAEVLASSGRLREASELAAGLVREAEQVDYLPVHAEALLVRSRLGMNLPDETPARVDGLTRAVVAGFEARDDAVAVEALALRIFAMARQPELAERALADEPLALALADRAADPEVLRGLVLNNIGTVHLARQQPELARRYFREALTVREAALGPDHRDVGYTLMNLAVATDPGPERAALLARALTILELELGPAHPEMTEARLSAAHLVDPETGHRLLQPGCLALDRFLVDDAGRRAHCLLHLGRLAVEVGDDAGAESSFIAAATLSSKTAGGSPLTDFEAAVLAGRYALATDAHGEAIARLQATIERLPDAWWARADAAELRLLLGQNLLAVGRVVEARDVVAASLADYAVLAASDRQFEPSQARARVSFAEVLLRLGPDAVPEARTHLAAAVSYYRGAGGAFARQLEKALRLAARISAG